MSPIPKIGLFISALFENLSIGIIGFRSELIPFDKPVKN